MHEYESIEFNQVGEIVTVALNRPKLNLANIVVETGALEEATQNFIAKIASKSPTSIRLTKKIVQGASMVGFGDMLVCEPELMQGLAHTGETRKGISAFMEKKLPEY